MDERELRYDIVTGRCVMYLTRWDPFRELEEMSDRLGHIMPSAFLPTTRRTRSTDEALILAEWAPLVDVEYTEREYFVMAVLP
jgi:HSP20 family protein